MECYDEKIKISIRKICCLLRENNVLDWAEVFEGLLHKFNHDKDKKSVARSIVNVYRGGMGSFVDLVLQKDMNMMIKENDQLEDLRHELFNACLNYIEINEKK